MHRQTPSTAPIQTEIEDIAGVTFVAGEENTISGIDAESKNQARRRVVNG
jgi:hypothetical protein